MAGAFERAWSVSKGMPSWDEIQAAGAAKEAEGGSEADLVRLIQLIDDLGESMSAERKAVDLMLNSGWSLEDTMKRMGNTFSSRGPEGEMLYDGAENTPEHHISHFHSDFGKSEVKKMPNMSYVAAENTLSDMGQLIEILEERLYDTESLMDMSDHEVMAIRGIPGAAGELADLAEQVLVAYERNKNYGESPDDVSYGEEQF